MIRVERRHGGSHVRLIIDQPKANLLTIDVMRALRRAIAGVGTASAVKFVTLEGAGDHFSYGASVEEHRPGVIEQALTELHGLIRELFDVPAPTAAIVRGRCIGGGFEVALACDLIFAGTTAQLGLPEISLGVFPPAGAALLPARVGASRAASAILTGAVSPVAKWVGAGLIELTAPDDELTSAVDRWFEANFAPRSAAALRCAARASRAATRDRLDRTLPELEHLYLDTLMRSKDAVEGIEAFLEKRAPVWSHL